MLVLTRQNGESLQMVTENDQVIDIKITGTDGKQVRIGFDAPADRRLLQKELLQEYELTPEM